MSRAASVRHDVCFQLAILYSSCTVVTSNQKRHHSGLKWFNQVSRNQDAETQTHLSITFHVRFLSRSVLRSVSFLIVGRSAAERAAAPVALQQRCRPLYGVV